MQRTLLLPALLLSCALVAQTTCDSVHIESVRYAPFGDGLHVSIHNGSAQFLSGPTLDLLDAEGDTLVAGVMEFFGVMPGNTQWHQLHFTPQPTTPFTGTLRLNYFEQNGMVTCTFPLAGMDLCPTEACIPLQVYAYTQGGPVETDLDWSVTDADNTTLASGVLELPATGFGFMVADLCLPPGAYTLHMAQAVAAGTIIQMGMTQAGFAYTDGTNTQLPIGGSVEHSFSFYSLCADATQGITARATEASTLIVDGRTLRIATNDGSAPGNMVLLDGMGRVARTINANTSTTFSDLSGLSSGVYILRASDDRNAWPAQRFILP